MAIFATSGIDRALRPRERLPGPRPLPQPQRGLFVGCLLRFEVETSLLEEVVDLLGEGGDGLAGWFFGWFGWKGGGDLDGDGGGGGEGRVRRR